MKRLTVFLVTLAISLPTSYLHARKKPVTVIITAGQSNTDGRVSNDDLPSYIKENGYSYCKWGYDAIVYYLIEKSLRSDFYVIKESLGGTAIDTHCSSNNGMYWSADKDFLASTSASDKGGKSLLKAFTENIGSCIDNVLSHEKNGYQIKAFLWHQGESDKKMADNYYDNLKAVVSYVRDYLVEKTGDERYRHLPFVCGTFSRDSRDRSEVIVSALYKLEAEDENFHVVDISDGSLLSDRLHFDAKGAERLGMRMFKELIKIKAVSTRNKEVINLLRNSQ